MAPFLIFKLNAYVVTSGKQVKDAQLAVNPSLEAWTGVHPTNSWLTLTSSPLYLLHSHHNLSNVHKHENKYIKSLLRFLHQYEFE